MGRIGHASESLAGIHSCPEYKFQHTAGLVVNGLHRHLPLTQEREVWSREIIVVKRNIAFSSETIGIGSHLHIQTVGSRLLSIMGATPVRDHNPVEIPVALEDFVEHTGVV